MKKKLIALLVVIFTGSIMACGGGEEPSPQPGSKWPLIEDDGVGVIFTSYDQSGEVASQVKIYDNTLRKILNDESFNGGNGQSNYELSYASSRIYLFGISYDDVAIEQIVCDYEKGTNTQLQLAYDCYEDTTDFSRIVETYEPSPVRTCLNTVGIPWYKLIHMANVPMKEDKTIYCVGGNKTFYLDIFKEEGLNTDSFTLYFDFIANTFRGKMVLTEVGQDPAESGKVLIFNGL